MKKSFKKALSNKYIKWFLIVAFVLLFLYFLKKLIWGEEEYRYRYYQSSSDGKVGRFVRIESKDPDSIINLAEVEIYDINNNLIQPAFFDSNRLLDGFSGNNFYDKNVNTFGHTDKSLPPTNYNYNMFSDDGIINYGYGYGHWYDGEQFRYNVGNQFIQFDLGADRAIGKIVIINRRDCCQDRIVGSTVSIKKGDDQVVWSTVINEQKPEYTFYLSQKSIPWTEWESDISVDYTKLQVPWITPITPIFNELISKGELNFFPFKVVTAQYLADKGYLSSADYIWSGSRGQNIFMYSINIPVGSRWAPVGDLFIASRNDPNLSMIPVVLVRNESEYSVPIEPWETRWVSDSWKCRNPDQLGWWGIDKYINNLKYKGVGGIISRFGKQVNPLDPSQRGGKQCIMNAVNKKYLSKVVENDQDGRIAVGNDNGSKCGADHFFYMSSPFFTMQVNSNNTGWWNGSKPFYNFVPASLTDKFKDTLTPEEQQIKNALQSTLKFSKALGRNARFDELPLEYPNLDTTIGEYSLDELIVVAKKYAPMCIHHKDENFYPSSVDWFMQHTKPVYQEDWGKDKSFIFAQTRQKLGEPTDTLDFFRGERPVPIIGHPKYKTESRVESYCSLLPRADGSIDLVYFFFYPYNWGKHACVGAGALMPVLDALGANVYDNEEFRYSYGGNDSEHFRYLYNNNEQFRYTYENDEQFRYRYDTDEQFRYAWWNDAISWVKGAADTVKGGFEDAASWTKGAANTVAGGLKTGWDGFDEYVAKPISNLFTKGCLGNIVRFGNHVGDIEGCRIRLDRNLKPVEMYFGAHDFNYILDYTTGQVFQDVKNQGRVLDASVRYVNVDDNGLVNSDSAKNTHTVLYMSKGSHGTWASPGKHDYTPKQTDLGAKVATTLSGLRLQDSTSNMDEGIPWMTWKDLRVLTPEEWSGKVPIPSEWTKLGVTNWVTQVGRWGNREDEFSENKSEKVAGQRRLVDGPSGLSGKYAGYAPYQDTRSKLADPVIVNDNNKNAIRAISTSRLAITGNNDPLNLSSYNVTNPKVLDMLRRTKSI